MLHKEKTKRKGKAFWLILAVVALSLCLLALISWLNIDTYKWIFELVILLAAVCAVYYILRTGYYEYSYTVIDNILVFKQNIGKGERYVFSLDLKYLRKVLDKTATDAEIKRLDQKAVPKYYVSSHEDPVWGLLYYDHLYKCEKILTFTPSEQLLEILSKKALDNGAEM